MDKEQRALAAARLADEKKAEDIKILDVRGVCNYADFLVVCTGHSHLQLQAIADAVEKGFGEQGIEPVSIDGRGLSSWIVLDFGDVIVHIMGEEARRFYALENLWGDAKEVAWAAASARPARGHAKA